MVHLVALALRFAGNTADFASSVVTSTTQTAVDLAQISGSYVANYKDYCCKWGSNCFSGIEVDGLDVD